jgi:prevent-host-death family protein
VNGVLSRGLASNRVLTTNRPLAEIKDDLSRYLRLAVDEAIVITRHGRPAGVLIGFDSEETGSNTASKIILNSCGG